MRKLDIQNQTNLESVLTGREIFKRGLLHGRRPPMKAAATPAAATTSTTKTTRTVHDKLSCKSK
jgi:hypothetical protein